MIDTKDLMIGNWVKAIYPDCKENEVYRVAMPYKNIVTLDYIEEDDSVIRFQNDYIHPIPVTPELLERIGFEKRVIPRISLWETFTLCLDGFGLTIRVFPDKKDLQVDGRNIATIGGGDFAFLHELQNLVRVITGHDLPITKEMLG